MIDFSKGPILMGVVNVTPDSFSDGGEFFDAEKAIAHGMMLEREGAQILDIGGESTRPGAKSVSPEEEQARVLPVIEGLKKAGVKALLSIDTRNAETMRKALHCGGNIVNDISALTHDPESLDVVSGAQVPVILMHMQGTPDIMQNNPQYADVVQEIFDYLSVQIERCLRAGILREKIICDPGIGFGKRLEDNLNILQNMDKFHHLDCPIVLGASRKSFIEKLSPAASVDQRLGGSIAAAIAGLEQGVQIFRVHDVAQTKQSFEVWRNINRVNRV